MKSLLVFLMICIIKISSPLNEQVFVTSLKEYTCNTAYSSKVLIKELDASGITYGHSIWIKTEDKRFKAKYFAQKSGSQSIKQRHSTWKSNKKIIAYCSAGYTLSDYKTPKGLSVENGKVINNSLDKDMEGIVLLYNGKITIFNTAESFYFKHLNRNIKLTNNYSKQLFMNWVRTNKATLFQTHLLVLNDQLKIDNSGRKKPARRKILAQVSKDGESFTIIFYVKQGAYLYDAAKKLKDLLKDQKNTTITSMVNLDTGLNDVLELNTSLKVCNGVSVSGREKSNLATNLLSFYYE